MASESAILALDGAINILSALEGFLDDERAKQAVFGAMAAVGTARVMIAAEAEEPEPEKTPDGECAHPESKVRSLTTGGGVTKVCDACQAIL